MPKFLTSETVARTQERRLKARKGARVRVFKRTVRSKPNALLSRTVQEDVSGNCLNPVFRPMHGRAEAKTRTRIVTSDANGPRFAEFMVPCRNCRNCLQRRAYHWRMRAKAEYMFAARTWMGTLTLDPEVLYRAKTMAASSLREAGVDWEKDLDPRERFKEIDKLIYREFQKRFDLLRKKSGVPLRYLAVTEVHNGGGQHHGEPHWHVLLHECDRNKPLKFDPHFSGYEWDPVLKAKKRVGNPFWLCGFQNWKLKRKPGDEGFDAKNDDPTYVTKYLSKDLAARVRASKYYGECSGSLTPPNGVAAPEKEGESDERC